MKYYMPKRKKCPRAFWRTDGATIEVFNETYARLITDGVAEEEAEERALIQAFYTSQNYSDDKFENYEDKLKWCEEAYQCMCGYLLSTIEDRSFYRRIVIEILFAIPIIAAAIQVLLKYVL